MTTERHDLSDADVWAFLEAGCNVNEIAAYAGVTRITAIAMVAHATRTHARSA